MQFAIVNAESPFSLNRVLFSAKEGEGRAQTESDWNGNANRYSSCAPGEPRYGRATRTRREKNIYNSKQLDSQQHDNSPEIQQVFKK
jgi:hypothetical protein